MRPILAPQRRLAATLPEPTLTRICVLAKRLSDMCVQVYMQSLYAKQHKMWQTSFVVLPHSVQFYTNQLHINLLALCGRHIHFRSLSNPCHYPSSFPPHLIFLTIRMVKALSERPRP